LKKLLSILLLVAFFAQTTSQFWIIASFFINRNYIAANICINRFDTIPVCKGSCYLKKKLNEDSKQQQNVPDIKLKEITLFCEQQFSETSLKAITMDTEKHFLYNSHSHTSQYLQSVFHPPQA
jgi:hypothetical protein